jgi:hypothetical protein
MEPAPVTRASKINKTLASVRTSGQLCGSSINRIKSHLDTAHPDIPIASIPKAVLDFLGTPEGLELFDRSAGRSAQSSLGVIARRVGLGEQDRLGPGEFFRFDDYARAMGQSADPA